MRSADGPDLGLGPLAGGRLASARVAQIVKSWQGNPTHMAHTPHTEGNRGEAGPRPGGLCSPGADGFIVVVCVWRLDGCGEEGARSVERRGERELQVVGALSLGRQQAVRGCSTLAVAIVGVFSQPAALRPEPPDSIGQVLRAPSNQNPKSKIPGLVAQV